MLSQFSDYLVAVQNTMLTKYQKCMNIVVEVSNQYYRIHKFFKPF